MKILENTPYITTLIMNNLHKLLTISKAAIRITLIHSQAQSNFQQLQGTCPTSHMKTHDSLTLAFAKSILQQGPTVLCILTFRPRSFDNELHICVHARHACPLDPMVIYDLINALFGLAQLPAHYSLRNELGNHIHV